VVKSASEQIPSISWLPQRLGDGLGVGAWCVGLSVLGDLETVDYVGRSLEGPVATWDGQLWLLRLINLARDRFGYWAMVHPGKYYLIPGSLRDAPWRRSRVRSGSWYCSRNIDQTAFPEGNRAWTDRSVAPRPLRHAAMPPRSRRIDGWTRFPAPRGWSPVGSAWFRTLEAGRFSQRGERCSARQGPGLEELVLFTPEDQGRDRERFDRRRWGLVGGGIPAAVYHWIHRRSRAARLGDQAS